MEIDEPTDSEISFIFVNQNNLDLIRQMAELLAKYKSLSFYGTDLMFFLEIDRKFCRQFVSSDFGSTFHFLASSRFSRKARKIARCYEFEVAHALGYFHQHYDIATLNGFGVPFFGKIGVDTGRW
jgi:hypothetical protein